MSIFRKKLLFTSCLVVLILLAAGEYAAAASSGRELLPDGLVMESTFMPGRGRSIGKIQVVVGEAVIIHGDGLKGYAAERGLHLYAGDALITLESAKLRFRLNDGSILSMASETKMTLNKSVYQKKTKERSSFLSMVFGKARFFVVKLLDYKRSEFRVKTPTAVCGVRGSDFILEVSALETTATALQNTELEFRSLAFLDEEPMILRDYETSTARLGQHPTPRVKLPPQEIERKRQEFLNVTPEAAFEAVELNDLAGKIGDDTGVGKVGPIGGAELALEAPEKQDKTPVKIPVVGKDEFQEKILPVPIPPEIRESIMEETPAGELPDFPNKP
ncbi:MAG: FecR domain-containing protein [Deltaproteobacteria bacterium]